MRAQSESIGYYPLPRAPFTTTATAPNVLFVVPVGERRLYTSDNFNRFYAHTAAEALRMVTTVRPHLVVLDWDDPSLGGRDVCSAASALDGISVLVMTSGVENAPAILKAGCQSLLLKPFAPSLLAGRIGRVIKETENGTNRRWPDVPCPTCSAKGVTSFDFSSYRRMWYACLACDATWLGPRKE